MASRSSHAGSSSSGSGATTGSSGSLATLDAGETCSYLAPSAYTGCRAPRSCSNCLQIEGCMVDSVGKCVSPSDEAYDPSMGFRNAISLGLVQPNATANATMLSETQMWQFPSGQTRYCNSSDATCASCRANNFWRSRSTFPDSRYCLGEDKSCVCVDVCERRWYVQADCSWSGSGSGSSSYLYDSTDSDFANRLWRGALAAIVFCVVFLLVMLRRRKFLESRDVQERAEVAHQNEVRREARRQRRHARAAALGVDTLTLSGWQTHRRDLIDKETAQLAGGANEAVAVELDSDVSSGEEDGGAASPREGRTTTAYIRMEEGAVPQTTASVTPAPVMTTTTTTTTTPMLSGNTQRMSLATTLTGRPLLAPLSTARPQQPSSDV